MSNAPVVLTSHTVDTDRGIVAGLLVRSAGRQLGFIWRAGSVWRWRTPNGDAFGERATQRAATDVLVDIAKVRGGGITTTAAPRPAAPRPAPRPIAAPQKASAPPPEPAAPRKPIVWADVDGADLTAALNRAWRTR
jgi:hypothetical protein